MKETSPTWKLIKGNNFLVSFKDYSLLPEQQHTLNTILYLKLDAIYMGTCVASL